MHIPWRYDHAKRETTCTCGAVRISDADIALAGGIDRAEWVIKIPPLAISAKTVDTDRVSS